MATLQNLYDDIKELIHQKFETKTEEDTTLPEIVESYFNYSQGELDIDMPHIKLKVTGSSFATYSSTPFTYTGKIFINWGDDTIVEYTGGKLSHNFSDGLNLHTIKVYGNITHLRGSCFRHCSGLTSITLSNSVTNLEDSCFRDCTGLTSVILPNSVTSLGEYCFGNCIGLTSVILPNSITSLENSCFRDCTGLTSIELSNSITNLKGYCFEGCTGLTSMVLPNSITNLGISCFESCTHLTSIHLNWNSSTNIITYNSSWIPYVSALLKFSIPVDTTQLYIDKGYPSNKLVERD